MTDRTSEEEFDRLADTIYEAMPEGQLYEAMADNAASAVIADGWMSRAAVGDAQAREAELVAGPLRARVERVGRLADEWMAWGRTLLLSAAEEVQPRHYERGMTYLAAATVLHGIVKEEGDD